MATGPAQPRPKIWDCKIGEVHPAAVPYGADLPMRQAVRRAYLEVTGQEPAFIFSGWGGELTEPERAVVENREPRTPVDHPTGPGVDTRWTLDPKVAHAEALVEVELRRLRDLANKLCDELRAGSPPETVEAWRCELENELSGSRCEEHNLITPGSCDLCNGDPSCCCYCADDADPSPLSFS